MVPICHRVTYRAEQDAGFTSVEGECIGPGSKSPERTLHPRSLYLASFLGPREGPGVIPCF